MKFVKSSCERPNACSRSPQGERGLKSGGLSHGGDVQGRRSPQGERGLKYASLQGHAGSGSSLSARRAWIEITFPPGSMADTFRRSPQGERGLKSGVYSDKRMGSGSRSPQGERGLKSASNAQKSTPGTRRSPQGERGLKLPCTAWGSTAEMGRSPQGERGLKFPREKKLSWKGSVALRKESVD